MILYSKRRAALKAQQGLKTVKTRKDIDFEYDNKAYDYATFQSGKTGKPVAGYLEQYKRDNPVDYSSLPTNDTNQQDVTMYGDTDNYDYTGKEFYPSSYNLSQYKQFTDQGLHDKARGLVLGHFGAPGGSGGTYSPGTHGEGVKRGMIKPIAYKNLPMIPDASINKYPQLMQLLKHTDYIE